MSRAVAHFPPREMAILGLVECALSFGTICLVVPAAGTNLAEPGTASAALSQSIPNAVAMTLVLAVVAVGSGVYRPEVCLDRKRLAGAGFVATAAFAMLLLASGAASARLGAAPAILAMELLGGWIAAIVAIRLLHGLALRCVFPARRILVIGAPPRADWQAGFSAASGRLFTPVRFADGDLSPERLRQRRIWGVIVGAAADPGVVEALRGRRTRRLRVLTLADFHERYLGRVDVNALAGNDAAPGRKRMRGRTAAIAKRLCDIVIGSAAALLAAPLMLLAAAAVKLDGPGPVFYRQQRIGRFGEPFTLLKFRSMVVDAEANGVPLWAQRRDPRVTRVGRFIRTTRIDELPQLVNVLRGTMSLVGPRPERPHFVAQLARAIPSYNERSDVKPGLTGWAQVNFPYGASVEDAREKLAYDLYYARNQSFVLDMAILLATARVVLNGQGAR